MTNNEAFGNQQHGSGEEGPKIFRLTREQFEELKAAGLAGEAIKIEDEKTISEESSHSTKENVQEETKICVDEAERKLAAGTDQERPVDGWTARSFQDAMKGSQGKPPWVIEDLLLAQSATLVSAQPHAM